MPVIALVGNKGGAGKTTLCINLACGLNRRYPTVLLDADPQRSSLQWREFAPDEEAARRIDVVDAVEDLVRDRDAVSSVMDTLGSVAQAASQAASQAAAQASGRGPGAGAGGDDDDPPHVQHIRVS